MAVEERNAAENRRILLTGGSSGIGFEATTLLLKAGHRLTLPCRDSRTAAQLRQRLGGRIETTICDLADLSSIERCAASLLAEDEPIDTLVSTPACSTAAVPSPAGRPRDLNSPLR